MFKINIQIIFFLYFLLSSLFLNGQVKLSGTFIDKETKKPIDFLRIIIQNQINGNKGAVYTDSTGEFNISTSKGHYNVYAIYLLSDTLYGERNITLDKNISLGIVEVSFPEDTLGMVTIDAKRTLFTRKVDRLIFNVEHSIAASTGNALDALALTPGVRVNGNNISIAGKGNVMIMLGDRVLKLAGDDLANYLATISSSSIKQIEVITTPPAKYNADGNSGIIRIILKEAIPNEWKLSMSGSVRRGTFISGGGGINFEINKEKFSFYSSLNSSIYNRRNSFNNSIFYEDELWMNSNPTDFSIKSYSGRIGMNYLLSKKWIVGLDIMGNYSLNNSDRTASSHIHNNSQEKLYSIISTNIEEKPSLNIPIGLYSVIKLDTSGRLLTINLDYFSFKDDKTGHTDGASFDALETQLPSTAYSTINKNKRQINNYSGNVDLEYPTKFININLGTYLSFTSTLNTFSFLNNESGDITIDTNQTNEFEFIENKQAFYISGSKSLSKKIDVQMGFRIENIQSKGYSKTIDETNRNDYLSLFPSLYALYKINKKSSLNLTYSRRIDRPNYEMLNPFRTYLTPLNYAQGNPFLLPSFSNNFELNYDTKNNNLQLFYTYRNNDFGQVAFVEAEKKSVFYSYYNYLQTNSVGLYDRFHFGKIKWWDINFVYLFSYEISHSTLDFTLDKLVGTYSFLSMENSLNLNKKRTLKLYVEYTYNFQSISGLSETSSYGVLYASFQAKLFNKKLTLGISMSDILKTAKPIRIKYSNGIKREISNYYDNQQIKISLYYSFGNRKININKRNGKNGEEKNRLN